MTDLEKTLDLIIELGKQVQKLGEVVKEIEGRLRTVEENSKGESKP